MNTTHILTGLHKVIDISEQIFLDLSNNFPILISELDNAKSVQKAGYTKTHKFDIVAQNLSDLISAEDLSLQADKLFFESFHKKNQELFTNLSANMDFLTQMTDLILKIKDESMEMEIISLNAMIVSIKSGKEGHAFSYITDNLKRLSYKLINQSDKLISYESSIQKNIILLKATIDEVSEKDAASTFFDENMFSEILQNIELITESLTRLNGLSKEVKQPIVRAMETIQLQDIIRQSLNDVELTVSKIEEPLSSQETEARLDQYVFNVQLAELAVTLITEVDMRISESMELFQENRKLTNNILVQVDEQRTLFMQNFLESNGSHTDKKNFQSLIASAVSDFENFIRSVYNYQTAQTRVLEKSMAIQDEVAKTQLCFYEFFPIINNLQYVAIAQRIEVARNTAIESIRSTVEHMSDLIVQTNTNVEEAQMQLQNFMDSSSSLVQRFSSETAQNKVKFDIIKASKASFLENLQFFQQEFIELLSNFTIYSPGFISSYDAIGAGLDSLEDLSEILKNAQKSLQEVVEASKISKQKILSELNLETWEIHNNKFTDFIKHFTIVADKQTAGLLGGFEVESGTTSGEITFF